MNFPVGPTAYFCRRLINQSIDRSIETVDYLLIGAGMLSQGYNPGNGTDSPTLLREPLLSESDGMVDKTLYVDPARKQKKKKNKHSS